MKTFPKTQIACSLFAASIISSSQAAIVSFSDDFSGDSLDSAWSVNGDGGSFDAANDAFQIINDRSGGGGGTELRRNIDDDGSVGSFSSSITVTLSEFSNPSTGADFKWKFFGSDGFTEIVLNSFGDMRMFHNDSDGGGGNIQPNTNIGLTGAGDLLVLSLLYDAGSDTVDVLYSLNGGEDVSFYSGTGVDDRIGDLATNFVVAQVFEFGVGDPVPTIQIQEWSMTAIPEPSTSMLLLGCLGFFLGRRRR